MLDAGKGDKGGMLKIRLQRNVNTNMITEGIFL